MLNNQNTTTVKTTTQAPVWMLDYSGELKNEKRTGRRDSSGKFLKRNCKLNTPKRVDDFNEMLAAESFANAA